jgi:hypothetical protein
MTVHAFPAFPDFPAITKAKAEADRHRALRAARRHKLEALEGAFMRQGMSQYRAKRMARLQLSASARKMLKLAESVRAAALDDIIAYQGDLADMRRSYYAPEPEICWADRIDFSGETL